ncbi:MAG: NnrS family protein [Alphaproteobacteria bacterium]|nr:NnrS family protein [Alphaproteobacteria bacterium]
MSTAAARRAYAGPALFSFGFRPFFLFGSIWAALTVPIWLGAFLHGGPPAITRDWHIHEMLFGFLGAVIAGFLTTAVPNWTGRMPVLGGPLAGLFLLWLAGRLAMLFEGPSAAVVDCLFLVAFAGVVWREVLAGKNWRNLPVCVLVSLFALANIAFHVWPQADLGVGVRLALGVAATLISLIGGRIIPSFTRNWMRAQGLDAQPAQPERPLDKAALALTAAGALLWAIAPQAPVTGAALALAGLGAFARLARWQGLRTLKEPMLWVLHLGYFWLALGLVLLGASILTPLVPRTAGIHALTAGAIGVMTLAVMSRATRGHTGRPLQAGAATRAIYLAINLAALTRVAAAFLPATHVVLLSASALLWVLAFAGFAAAYWAMLTQPRPAAA